MRMTAKKDPTAYIISRKGVHDLEAAYFELDSFLLPQNVRLQPSHRLRVRRVADSRNFMEYVCYSR